MSLLMDELKKAERPSRVAAADVDVEDSAPVQMLAPPVTLALSSPLKPSSFERWMRFVSSVSQSAGKASGWLRNGWVAMVGGLKTASRQSWERIVGVLAMCQPVFSKIGAGKRLGARNDFVVVALTLALIGLLTVIIVWVLHGKYAGLSPSEVEKKQASVNASAPQPSLQGAEAALKAGKTEQARAEYQRLLSAQPDHLEALRGLASLSQQAGKSDAALAYYQHILRMAPQDIQAQVAVARIQSQKDPSGAETRLKALIASQPRLVSAHDALGNLYAGQERWNDAQAAFLQAYRNAPDNPDILYSLAISYDHLQQVRQALMFYRLAQKAATTHPASFDRNRMSTRIEILTALLEP